MINLTQTKHIQQTFSRAAARYDVYSEMHRSIARKLMANIPDGRHYHRILDVGQGTGWMTQKIKCRYPKAQVVGMDLAPGMALFAKKKYDSLSIVQATAAQLPFKDGAFDLVTSNLVYQWLDNLEEAFKLIHSALNPQGVFCVTLFGKETLAELFDSLIHSCHEDSQKQIGERVKALRRLPDHQTVSEALRKAGFKDFTCDVFEMRLHFENMFSVMKWVKAIGANALEKNFYLGRDRLLKADQYYRTKYSYHGGVSALFEVFNIRAKR